MLSCAGRRKALLEFEELKLKQESYLPELSDLKEALDYDNLTLQVKELEEKTLVDGFWDDIENSQKTLQKISQLKNKITAYNKLKTLYDDLLVLIEIGNEEGDLSLLDEINQSLDEFVTTLSNIRLTTLLNGEFDSNNAILTFHAGAGGTEAQDWNEMLVRMYTRWGERHNFKVSMLDFLDGEEAGLKSAVLRFEGDWGRI